ncbi:hypothetical protein GCM10022420_042930 [Streptomyces iranensis]|uniref:hypothetical protein n=1 Tax=Streptomyces iranensis TaxID=576784 RepID=UPI000B3000C3
MDMNETSTPRIRGFEPFRSSMRAWQKAAKEWIRACALTLAKAVPEAPLGEGHRRAAAVPAPATRNP